LPAPPPPPGAGGAGGGPPPLDVDDGNLCTDDSCDTVIGAVYVNNTTSCDDGDACSTVDACSAGACAAGPPLAVDDSNPCTDDSCDSATGAVYANNTASCEDGDACSTDDVCAAGACTAGPALDFDDANECTDDSCDPAIGAVNLANAAPCDDGSLCTTGDTCAAGSCAGGPALDVDDSNECTDDSCDPAIGAVNLANIAPCDDGSLCTTVDTCADGACQGGSPLDVDDANPCTDDSCDPATGAVYADNTASCDDGDTCTEGDVCSAGVCLTGETYSCELYACGDSLDNDGDFYADYPSDLECTSPDDDSEVGSPLVATVDFTQMGDLAAPVLHLQGLTLSADTPTGASGIVIAQSVDEFGGAGASGGADPAYVDEDERLRFDFTPGSVTGLSYRMHQSAPSAPDQPFSPYTLTVWDGADNVTFSDTVQQVGTVDVSAFAGGAVVGGFEIASAFGYPIQVSQLTYADAPDCGDGVDSDGDTLVDYPSDPECASASGSEVGTPGPATEDFTQMGSGAVADLDLGTVWVGGSDPGGSPANLVLTEAPDEFGGIGVEGGPETDYIDDGETVIFDFSPGRASNVSYRMHQVSNALPAELFTPYVVTIWDADGNLIFSQSVQRIGTVDVSALVGGLPIGAFRVESQAGGNALCISQIHYGTETRLVDTIQLVSIASQDGYLRESSENTGVGNYAVSTRNNSTAIRAGDQKKDKQLMGVVSFDASSLPAGASLTRATLNLTTGRTRGNVSGLGDLVVDVQTGGFGSSTALAGHDFEATATAPAAAVLTVGSSQVYGDLGPAGLAAIDTTGVTQLRVRFEVDDNDNARVDNLNFYSTENATSSRRPILELEYEYWGP
jgi:hypothetical protein